MRKLRTALSFILTALTVLGAAASAFAAADTEQGVVLPGGIAAMEGTGIAFVQTNDGGYEVRGLTAAPSAQATRAEEFLGWFTYPDGTEGEVSRGTFVLRPNEIVATGDFVSFYENGVEVSQAVIVVMGDILGNGILSLMQLVRLASVVTGSVPALTGPYQQAADLNGDGTISIGDIVIEARLYTDAMLR